jgi:hypothetical protein
MSQAKVDCGSKSSVNKPGQKLAMSARATGNPTCTAKPFIVAAAGTMIGTGT